MHLLHRFHSRTFLAPDDAPAGGASPVPPKEEPASIFDGITVNKEGLTKTVTGDELKATPKTEEKPVQGSPIPPVRAGAVPIESREKGPSHARFKEVTDARDKAVKEFETARKEWEAKQADYETKLSKGVVPEEVRTQLAEALTTKSRLEADLHEVIVDRAARAEFEPRKLAALEKIGLIAAAAGDHAMIDAAQKGNYDALAEFADTGELTALQKRDINRLLDEARGADEQLSQRTKDPEAAWKALEQRNRAQMEELRQKQIAGNIELARQTHTNLLQYVTALADAPELSKEVRTRLEALAGGQGNERYTAKHMMQVVAEHTIFETLCKNQQAKIAKLEADLKGKTETVDRLKAPSFRNSHVEQETETETVGTGLFTSGLVVNASGR